TLPDLMTTSQLQDDLRRECRAAAGPEAFPVESLGDRGVILTRIDSVSNPCQDVAFPVGVAEGVDGRADQSLTDEAATPRDPDPNHAGFLAIEINARHQRSEQRLSGLDGESVP